MSDYKAFVELIKRIAVEAVEAGKPAGIYTGTVSSTNPLKVSLSQKITLEDDMLILPRHLTDYNVDMTVNGYRQSYIVHNKLKSGDVVVLVRAQEGQEYLIIDRVVS